MATPQVTDHVDLAQEFLRRSKEYLESGDLHQASEKGWGAASHIIKAVAAANAARGWEYEHHDHFDAVVQKARQWYRQPSLMRYADSAEQLHRNYYRRKIHLDADLIGERIGDVERMVVILVPFLMDE